MDYMAVLIMMICTMANHMGLVAEVERLFRITLYVLNCCKCSTFWLSSAYMIITGGNIIESILFGFFLAYAAIWFELLLGLIDRVYEYIYEKTYTKEGSSTTENVDGPENGMP